MNSGKLWPIIREDFPLLNRILSGRPVVYFDSAATSLKPRPVIEAVTKYLVEHTSNTHRSSHVLADETSVAFEEVRRKCAEFLNVGIHSVVFVRGVTDAANLLAEGLRLGPNDNVVGSVLEHHSNILPWSSRCEYRAAELDPVGLPDLESADAKIDRNTRLVAISHASNVTGAVVPVEKWVELAHSRGVPIFIDAAQTASHLSIDATALKCDFLAFSGHKIFGPPGSGVLYGKPEYLETMDPVYLGGGAVSVVHSDYSYNLRSIPWRLEAGTPDIASIIGMGAAVDYLTQIGWPFIKEQCFCLHQELLEHLQHASYARPLELGNTGEHIPIVSLSMNSEFLSPTAAARILSDSFGVMTRAGYHCAHPLHSCLGLEGTLRISLHCYNNSEEIKYFADCWKKIEHMCQTLS